MHLNIWGLPSLLEPASTTSIIQASGEHIDIHPIIFECAGAFTIRSASLRTTGDAESSGIDVVGWRRHCTLFYSASNDFAIFYLY